MALVGARQWIRPGVVHGRYRVWRRRVGWLLVAFFVLMPWITVGGLPAARFDIPGRRLMLMGTLFTPHDTWALALLLLSGSLALFLFTAVLGRIWCGWACPQTVWLESIFRPVERFIEGRNYRRADGKPRKNTGAAKAKWLGRKLLKHAVFLVMVTVTTGIFASWFVGGPELLRGEIGPKGLAVTAGLGFLFYLDVAWFREQFCHFACPYARLQGVLMSERSLVVAYDAERGEPRGKATDPNAGACIDCNKCVTVCPSGIDIRDGDQLQCISCTGCVDACNEVMVKIGQPQNLIRLTTRRDQRAMPGEARPALTPRSMVYGALFVIVTVILLVGLAIRPEMKVHAARIATEQLYSELDGDRVSNRFTIHVSNRATQSHSFTVRSGTDGVEVTVPGLPWSLELGREVRLQGFAVARTDAFTAGRLPAEVIVVRDDGVEEVAYITLLGPGSGSRAAPSKMGAR